jgi:hypothetical protein
MESDKESELLKFLKANLLLQLRGLNPEQNNQEKIEYLLLRAITQGSFCKSGRPGPLRLA